MIVITISFWNNKTLVRRFFLYFRKLFFATLLSVGFGFLFVTVSAFHHTSALNRALPEVSLAQFVAIASSAY